MLVSLCVLLAAACALADDSENRRSKLPYVADAVGNTLPPPSNVPATVGSPVNLLTPDRYEFYTFDESGELVKRLMTLEEIQAIVAAGEEGEGLVTFANDNQPTIAFNFSQPPYTKVHNVVTNVQNVLKAQMEAHKNKPNVQPTFDTPDVSDSWSLILPSIFGNTGVDIVPDKSSGTFTTPETETIELDRPIDDNSLSKEGSHQIFSSASTAADQELKENPITEKLETTTEKVKVIPTTTTTSTTTTTTTTPTPTTTSSTTTTTTTTTKKPTTTSTTTTKKPTTTSTTTTKKPTTTSTTTTTAKPTTTTTTTSRPAVRSTTTVKPSTTTTIRPQTNSTTSSKPRTTTTTTHKPTTKVNVRSTPKPTTIKPNFITKKPITTSTQKDSDGNFTRVQIQTNPPILSTTEKSTVQYEKISTFIPVSAVTYITERTTPRPQSTTKPITVFASTTKRSVPTTTKSLSTKVQPPPPVTTYKPTTSTSTLIISTSNNEQFEKLNATTVTTQSVSPSTTVSSIEFVTIQNNNHITGNKPALINENIEDLKESEQDIPLFDVAQSISQIASDLGNYRPIPTTSDLLDTTKTNEINLESKENLEMEMPVDTEKQIEMKNNNATNEFTEHFVKISTLVPHSQNKIKESEIENTKLETGNKNSEEYASEAIIKITQPTTTIDPVLSESMDDLLSQVVNQVPQSILQPEKPSQITTTEKNSETISIGNISDVDTTTLAAIKFENVSKASTKVPLSNSKNKIEINTNIKLSSQDNILSTETPKVNRPLNHEDIKVEKTQQNQKENVSNNFVKISQSTEKSEVQTESKFSTTIEPETNDIKVNTRISSHTNQSNQEFETNTKEKNPMENSNENETESMSVTLNSQISSTTLKPDTSTSQTNLNKTTSSENNKVDNKNEKVEISQPLPKIDEFKKKIQKVNIDDKEFANERNNSWKLISTVTPPKNNEIKKDNHKADNHENTDDKHIVLDYSKENQGLEVTTKDLGEDVAQFTELCNELAFRYWYTMIENIDKKRSFVLSPYSITSMLAMMFMGARGATSGEMNEILKLDDMVTFNPHFTLKNISDSIETSPESGVMVSAFVRELFTDRTKGKVLTFYKERAQHFYNGHVEEVNFKLISDIIRRRTNLLVKRYSWGRIPEYMKANTITMQPPLAAFSANIFQTDCSGSSVDGRDGEMYFVVSPNVRQRRLVPVPAVVYRHGFLAGYDPVLDATAAALGKTNSVISTLFLMPGQQGNIVHAEDLEALEKRLLNSNPTTPAWNRLLRTLLPRIGLELQIPRFSHKSIFNISSTLKMMGLKDLFDPEHADLGGLNGPSKDLYLSDMIQSTSFVTCGEDVIADQHHIEEYPENLGGPQRRRTSRWATGWDEPRDYQRAFHDPHDVGEAMHLPLHLRPRQARLPARDAQPARLKFDRPFLYFVRHNPSGMILYVGRYNPRLLP